MKESPGVQAGLNGAFMREGFGAGPSVACAGNALTGLRLAVKDVFDVQGMRTGGGNPAWLMQQAPSRSNAVAVERLLSEGAAWVGKTVTDELTYSLAGINAHYGTPVNPMAPDRLPGGSSSGSAVAVASGAADIALGTDCGGSVRLPASYCGIWGMRPTHGRIPSNGCMTLAHSFDTVGWFARNLQGLSSVFETLAHSRVPAANGRMKMQMPEDVLPLLDQPIREALESTLLKSRHLALLPGNSLPLASWADAFRVLQAAEAWMQHGAWVERYGSSLGADVRLRFESAKGVLAEQVAAAALTRVQAIEILNRHIADGGLLVLPTVPTCAPHTNADIASVEDARRRSQQFLCMAGLAGLPQVSLPWLKIGDAPVGLSVIGPRGGDESVLGAAQTIVALLN
jgi:amidase